MFIQIGTITIKSTKIIKIIHRWLMLVMDNQGQFGSSSSPTGNDDDDFDDDDDDDDRLAWMIQ